MRQAELFVEISQKLQANIDRKARAERIKEAKANFAGLNDEGYAYDFIEGYDFHIMIIITPSGRKFVSSHLEEELEQTNRFEFGNKYHIELLKASRYLQSLKRIYFYNSS